MGWQIKSSLPDGCAIQDAGAENIKDLHIISQQDTWSRWDSADLSSSLAAGAKIILLKEAMRIVGFFVLDARSVEAELHYLVVDSVYHQLGFGRLLLQSALEIAVSLGAESLFLEVRSSNIAALNLYASLGFKKIGVRAGYYSFPPDKVDAIVMRYQFL